MNDPLVSVTPWMTPISQMCVVCHALGYGIVTWPSGRRTLVQYVGTATMTDCERHASPRRHHATELAAAKVENVLMSLREWRRSHHPAGWFIRDRRGRPKARAVRGVAWIHPESYRGPAPQRGDVITPVRAASE